MFLALGLVLPFLTGQIPEIGSMLLPMHIPVFLCALICGWQYAVPMSFILPIMRSLIFTMPPMYPGAVAMAFEFAAYAFVAGFVYSLFKKQDLIALYVSMLTAMVAGRIVWGIAQAILLGAAGKSFTLSAFLAGAFFDAIPGIIVQLVLIPAVMLALRKAKLVPIDGRQ